MNPLKAERGKSLWKLRLLDRREYLEGLAFIALTEPQKFPRPHGSIPYMFALPSCINSINASRRHGPGPIQRRGKL